MFGFDGRCLEHRFEVGEIKRNPEGNEVFDARVCLFQLVDFRLSLFDLIIEPRAPGFSGYWIQRNLKAG